jgi:hypothetical protein
MKLPKKSTNRCGITEEMGGLLGKVILELTVEKVFNVGAEVEIGLELKVVEE